MSEAKPLAAKPGYWWRPVDVTPARARVAEAGSVGGWHSDLVDVRPWLGVRKQALVLERGAGMLATSSGGDRGCTRVDSPSLRLADKAVVGFSQDTGDPFRGGDATPVGRWDAIPSAIQGW